jgi:two-component system OmpR family response regulator
VLDADAWSAHWQGAECALTVTEFTLLKTLVAAPTRYFTRDQLIDGLHGPSFAVTDRTIDSHVRNLRRKFSAIGCGDIIRTKAGVGYRIGACCGGTESGD